MAMIYQRLKLLCKENGTSVNALEKKLQIGIGSLSRIDRHKPSSEKIQKLAKELNTSVDFIMTGKESDSVFSEESAHLVAKIRRDKELNNALQKYFELPVAKKKHIIELINLFSEDKKIWLQKTML